MYDSKEFPKEDKEIWLAAGTKEYNIFKKLIDMIRFERMRCEERFNICNVTRRF
jgi:hypothetical protein